ncbi:MAG: hypothetical protein V1907_03525 [Candidatus Kerfeldbacteria bacterium]
MPDKRRYADRAEYLKLAVAERRKTIKATVVEYKGGRCQICGYHRSIAALEFHHRVAATKRFSISGQGLTRSWQRVKQETDKCFLVCANCHRELHAGMRPHKKS